MLSHRNFLRSLLPIIALGAPLHAQVQAWEVQGSAAGNALATSLASAGDLDLDSVSDLLVGAARADFSGPNTGSVYALSGATGSVLHRIDGTNGGELFGDSVAPLEDLDNDGIADWIAGAPFASLGLAKNGRAEVRSGADGSFLFEVVGIEQFGLAGTAVAGLGDANGDLVPDVLVCAPFEDSNGTDSGTVSVHSGVNGAFIRSHVGDFGLDRLGVTALGLGDVDGDGIGDYGAGTPFGNNGNGMFRVWSGQTGNTIYTRLGTEFEAEFCSAVASLEDLTGDGFREVAIGVPGSDLNGADAGQVIVVNGASGAFIRFLWGNPGEALGSSVANAGDWNDDGTGDILVGAPGLSGVGSAYIFSGVDGALLATVTGEAGDQDFGSSVAGNFDVDGDGRSEFAVGDDSSDIAGNDAGVLRAYSDHSLFGLAYCFGDSSGTACPCGNFSATESGCQNSSGNGGLLDVTGTPSVATGDFGLNAAGLLPGKASLAFAGTEIVNGGAGFLFGDGLRCAGGAVQRLGVRLPNGSGLSSWGPGLLAKGGWTSGDTRYFQVWYRDSRSSPCSSAFNLTNGVQLSFLP